MDILTACPRCHAPSRFASEGAPEEAVCPGCGDRRPVRLSESIRTRNVVDQCAFCGCGHFYIEKDFNGYLGGAIVLGSIIASGIAWARNVYLSIGILAGAALLDLGVWLVARERTRCYRCEAVYRRTASNPSHGRYELGLAGRFADDYDEQRELHQR